MKKFFCPSCGGGRCEVFYEWIGDNPSNPWMGRRCLDCGQSVLMVGDNTSLPKLPSEPPPPHPVCTECGQDKLCSSFFPDDRRWEVECLGCGYKATLK